MRWLLLMLIAALAIGDIFSMGMSITPGLSVKNAMLYAVLMTLFFRSVISGEVRLERPDVHAYFAAWIAYAVLTIFLVDFVIEYPGYHLGAAIITLKSDLLDPTLFCLTAFWGLKEERDVRMIVRGLAVAMAVSSVFTLLDVAGIVHLHIFIGDSGVEEGRVFGVFGHANETGALLACFLPALFAETTGSRGVMRTLWVIGTFATVVVLLMTISRGAYAGLLIGIPVGAYLCRRYIPLQRIALWALVIAGMIVIALAVTSAIDPYLRGFLDERLFGQTMSVSLQGVSSGRTGLWSRILDMMMDTPSSLVLGFGWNVYSTTPFLLPTHNHYLDLWFNLGLVGIAMFALIMRRAIVSALEAIPDAREADKPMFIAFVLGLLSLLVALFFANLFRPWPYIWMYIGAIMRGALIVRTRAEKHTAHERLRPAAAAPIRQAGALTWSRRD